jgi:hypothetical protein
MCGSRGALAVRRLGVAQRRVGSEYAYEWFIVGQAVCAKALTLSPDVRAALETPFGQQVPRVEALLPFGPAAYRAATLRKSDELKADFLRSCDGELVNLFCDKAFCSPPALLTLHHCCNVRAHPRSIPMSPYPQPLLRLPVRCCTSTWRSRFADVLY